MSADTEDEWGRGTLWYVRVAFPSGRSTERGFAADDRMPGSVLASLAQTLIWLRDYLAQVAGNGVMVELEKRVDGKATSHWVNTATEVVRGAWDKLLDEGEAS
jgi:hypothetical protein